MKIKRTWEVTISQEVLDDLRSKGLGDTIPNLLWSCSLQADMGEFGTMFLVKYVSEDFQNEDGSPIESSGCWGTYNDVMVGSDETVVLFELKDWGVQELESEYEGL